jgi:hypothetical protein
MATTRTTRPASKPVGAARVTRRTPATRRVAAKKLPRKKPVAKSAIALKREEAAKRQARIDARAKTKAETNRVVGVEPIALDPADEPAQVAVAQKQRRLRALAGKPEPKPSARIKRTAVDRVDDPPLATGIALIERVTQAVERELSQIEVIVGGHHVKLHQRTEAERRARTLASLARTLSEVRKLRADEKPKRDNDDAVPRDLNEFRLELARRLDRLVAEAKAACPDETEPT